MCLRPASRKAFWRHTCFGEVSFVGYRKSKRQRSWRHHIIWFLFLSHLVCMLRNNHCSSVPSWGVINPLSQGRLLLEASYSHRPFFWRNMVLSAEFSEIGGLMGLRERSTSNSSFLCSCRTLILCPNTNRILVMALMNAGLWLGFT
jgi:hypothetical protein